jgi:hypothetical protein
MGVIRLRSGVALAIAIVLAAVPAVPAGAHTPDRFDSCAAHRREGGVCQDTATFVFGDRVFLRARVIPFHTGLEARVRFLRPGASEWRGGVLVPISDTGRMRWSFRSEKGDADQEQPWRFRFHIPRHGRSDTATVFILFGE